MEMKTKYQIIVNQQFFDSWQNDIEAWKQKEHKDNDSIFLLNMIDEFLDKAEISKLISTKYNDFEQEVYQRYIVYVKNQIYKILPLAEEHGEWRKHLDTLLVELTGSNEVFLKTINFMSLINKLETLKQFPEFSDSLSLAEIQRQGEFKIFRKTIFECMNIAESLNAVEHYGN